MNLFFKKVTVDAPYVFRHRLTNELIISGKTYTMHTRAIWSLLEVPYVKVFEVLENGEKIILTVNNYDKNNNEDTVSQSTKVEEKTVIVEPAIEEAEEVVEPVEEVIETDEVMIEEVAETVEEEKEAAPEVIEEAVEEKEEVVEPVVETKNQYQNQPHRKKGYYKKK